jgi:hypothetical protein
LFIVFALWNIYLFKTGNYLFRYTKFNNGLWGLMTMGFALSIFLTLSVTVSDKTPNYISSIVVVFTTLLSAAALVYSGIFFFAATLREVSDNAILFKSKDHPQVTISEQWLEGGALGGDRWRIVKVEPFLIWKKITPIDTSAINKGEWEQVSN